MEVEIKLVRHRQAEKELVDLFQASFKLDKSHEIWRWKYTENPLASEDPDIIVAACDGKIVGARPFVVLEFWIKSEKAKAALFSDTMVHPDYQGKGIFSLMNKFAFDRLRQDGCALFFNYPNKNSLGGYLRQGSKIVSYIEHYFIPVNPQKLISNKLNNRALGLSLGFLYGVLAHTPVKNPVQQSNSLKVDILDQFNPQLNSLDALRDRAAISPVRSQSYLAWRFDKNPVREFKYILLNRGEELLGYAVICIRRKKNGLVLGRIEDYLVKDNISDHFRLLISGCINVLTEMGVDIISLYSFTDSKFNTELTGHLGFKSPSAFPYNRIVQKLVFTVRLIDEAVIEKLDVYDRINWDFSLANPE